MDLLDLVIVAGAIAAGYFGFRLGLLTRATSWLGLLFGAYVTARALPSLVGNVLPERSPTTIVVGLVLIIAGAFVGELFGSAIGTRLHYRLRRGTPREIDKIFGAAAGIVAVFALVWLFIPSTASIPGWVSVQARHSAIARALSDLMPQPPDALAFARDLVGAEQFPSVFSALRAAPSLGSPPAASGLSDDVIARATNATVLVRGNACRREQEGTGVALAPDTIVTNAHVVAGDRQVEVVTSDNRTVTVSVVLFDADTDLAVLRSSQLALAPLELGAGKVGDVGGVFGHPRGGPLRIAPYRLGRQFTAIGRDLYDRHDTTRTVDALASVLNHGDSGAPVVSSSGIVTGIAFAIAPDRPSVAYAIGAGDVRNALNKDLTHAVSTGACTS